MDLDYSDVGWFALEKNQDLSFVFEIASKCCISVAFVDYEGYPISSKGFLPTVVDIMVMWNNLPFTIQFSSLTDKVSVFPLPSAWPHPIYLDSWASHPGSLCNIVLYSPGVFFHIQTQPQQGGFPLWPSLFILPGTISLLLPVAYWTPTDLKSSSCSVISSCLFILFMGFSRLEYWSGLPFPSTVDHVLSELSAMTCPSWVALHAWLRASLSYTRLWSMWCFWLAFSAYGFHAGGGGITVLAPSVCPLMDEDKRFVQTSWREGLAMGETRTCSGGQGRAP